MRIIVAITMVLFLLGCGKDGFFRDRSDDYEKAETCKILKVPADLKAEPFNDEYAIP